MDVGGVVNEVEIGGQMAVPKSENDDGLNSSRRMGVVGRCDCGGSVGGVIVQGNGETLIG